jgi:LCCL domain
VSLRERVLLVLGVIGAIALVVYPMAYRLSTQQAVSSTVATLAIAPSPLTATPATAAAPSPTPSQAPPVIDFGLPGEADWGANALEHRGLNGSSFDYVCPPNGQFGLIWGSDIYTDDSSVCTAGVHKGVIARVTGGRVTIIIRPGLASYEGTTRNGVTTESFEQWDGSYEVVVP